MMRIGTAAWMMGLGAAWCVLAGAVALPQPEKREPPKSPAPLGVAVIELFTSEGCNSCPAADDLAAKIARDAREQGKPVFVLAMHVDYWDYLGWKDPFAQSQFTKRQRAYAAALKKAGGNGGVFTPEMVVNGSMGFTGSDERQAKQAIERSIVDATRLKVEPSVVARKAGEPVKVRASVKGDTRWTMLCVAIVEDGLNIDVPKGENAGKTLRHDRVVRAFGQVAVKDDRAEVELKLPNGVKEAGCRVVVFAQEEKTMRIAGAAEIPLEMAVSTPPSPAPTPAK
jgi:hypothetical protein